MGIWNKNSYGSSNIYSGVPKLSGDGERIKENGTKCVRENCLLTCPDLSTHRNLSISENFLDDQRSYFHLIEKVSLLLANGVVEDSKCPCQSSYPGISVRLVRSPFKTWMYYFNILAPIHFLLLYPDTTSLCNTISQHTMKRNSDRKPQKLLNTSPLPLSSGLSFSFYNYER